MKQESTKARRTRPEKRHLEGGVEADAEDGDDEEVRPQETREARREGKSVGGVEDGDELRDDGVLGIGRG